MADEEKQPEEDAAAGLDELADENGENESENSEGKGLPLKKIILFGLVPIVLLGGIGAGLYFTGMLDSFIGTTEEDNAEGEDNGDGNDKKSKNKGSKDKKGSGYGDGGGDAVFLAVPTMIVNLKTSDGTPRYLRLTIQLELENDADMASIEAVLPRVVDQFQTYLRELRIKDLRGSAGIYRLQMELLWRVNQAAAPVEVKDVLFQEILIQ